MPGQSQQSTTQSPWMTSATDASRGRQPLTQAGDVSNGATKADMDDIINDVSKRVERVGGS